MKYSLLLLLFLFTRSCQAQNVPLEAKNITPQITIEYLNLVNGYKIKILWIPNKIASADNQKIVGPAIIELKKNDGKKYYANFTNFSIDIPIKNLKMKDEFVQSFTPTSIKKKYSAEKDPFLFDDVNFDMNNELIIYETGLLDYDRYKSRTFEFRNNTDYLNNTLDELNDPAFNDYANSTFDTINKEIVTIEYNGCCEYNQYYFKNKDIRDKNYFYMYKSEKHKVNTTTNKETITTKVTGEKEVVKIIDAKKEEE